MEAPIAYGRHILDELLHSTRSGGRLKLIVLAGAGVSIDPPACLPSGKALTDYYLECCFGRPVAERITARWSEIDGAVRGATGVSHPILRLESVIEKIDDVDREFGNTRLIEGFAQFSRARPNALHRHIASLAKRGAIVITPNFDCAIERALERQPSGGPGDGAGALPPIDAETSLYMGGAPDCRVYHYHGIGSDPADLGATVARVRRGFPPGFAAMLSRLLADGHSLLCVGFSCSDFFDATQFFESIPPGSCSGTGMFVNHGRRCAGEGASVPEYDLANQRRFLGAFRERRIVVGHTEQLLHDLVSKACGDGEAEANRKAAASPPSDVGEWARGFDAVIGRGGTDRSYHLVRLLNQFGFYLTDEDIAEASSGHDAGCALPSPLNGCSTMEEIVERTAKRYFAHIEEHGGSSEYFLDAERLPLPNRSVGFDLKMICGDIGFAPPSAQKVAALYDEATARREPAGPAGEPAQDSDLAKIAAEVHGCAINPSERVSTECIVTFVSECKRLVRNAFSIGPSGAGGLMGRCHVIAREIMGMPLRAFLFPSHLISVMKADCVMSAFLAGEGPEASVRSAAELAMQICFADEIPRIYRTAALADLALLMGFRGEAASGREEVVADLRKRRDDTRAFLAAFRVEGACKANSEWLRAIDTLLESGEIREADLRSAARTLVE